MKKNHRPRSLAAVTALLAALALALWLAGMYCVTSVAAEYAAARYEDKYENRASTIVSSCITAWAGSDAIYKNYRQNRLWEAVSYGDSGGWSPITGGSGGFLERLDGEEAFWTTAIYDAEGNCMERSWDDFFYFEYLTEAQWAAGEERSHNNARALFQREKLTEQGREMVYDSSLTFDAAAMRFTGTFDGVEFTPAKIECIADEAFREALRSRGGGPYTKSGVVQDYDLPWITVYEDPDALPDGAEAVTLYSDWFDVCFQRRSPAFSYRGREYGGVDALLEELGPALASGRQNLTRYEGLDLLIVSVNYCTSYEGETDYSSFYYGEDAYQGEGPALHFYTVSAVYCSPWRTAFRELRNVYLFTFLLAAALVLFVRSAIRRGLIAPVEQVNSGAEGGWREISSGTDFSAAWREPGALAGHYERARDTLRMRENEINRLNAALEYARTAEQNRRQMTSNIAHELKTPLAVIHSYAEGLKEHIAEDKRDRYLDVILSETERTDKLVLELLDLSRLEAGKVRLSRDSFSLVTLTRAVFEKLEMAAQEKELQISYEFPEQCVITADESRIGQAIENFATNAMKYTPAGGHVAVKIRNGRAGATFTVENEAEPLSEDALGQVWDTFYRADEARSGGGTGLGLAIAKSIIELHGGKCFMRNTTAGVEFGFTVSY